MDACGMHRKQQEEDLHREDKEKGFQSASGNRVNNKEKKETREGAGSLGAVVRSNGIIQMQKVNKMPG